MGRILAIVWKEFIEIRQDRKSRGILFVAPVVQLTLLGYAATTDVTNVPMVVVDDDRSPESEALIQRFDGSPYFSVAGVVLDAGTATAELERGRAWMALYIPYDYGRRIAAGTPAVVQMVADGSDANSSNIGLGYAGTLVAGYARELATAGRSAPVPGLDLEVRVWFNPELKSRDFMIPGVLALVLLVITANLSSMAIVRERELGTLEQLNVTPIGRWELIIGKLLPYAAVGMIDILLVSAVAVFWFEIPLRGSFALLFALSLLFVLCTLSLGLLSSTLASTQQQAMMTSAFFMLVPMVYLSGFIFPIENMPEVIQWVTYAIPLRYYLVIVRGVFLKGVGWETLWPQAAGLAICAAVILSVAALRSRKRAA
jgi:ABC-2 type transport system permease protein